ncbi:MAG TPA: hypothetical protein VGG27_20570 [Magnetospirillaceae bacterium]|jgi:predicted hotdog family 3-hydroxylacyl-ACP dehydratase
MTHSPSFSPNDLLLHRPPALLLDAFIGSDGDSITMAVVVRADDPFFREGLGIPAHIAIEWMAQTAGAFAGLDAKKAGEAVRIGFLLGTRNFRANRPWFAKGERLTVTAKLIFREEGMAVFECRVDAADGTEAAAARLTVYQPGDGEQNGGQTHG